MVIVGGSGNNLGAIFGGFVIWFAWIEVAPLTTFLIETFTAGMDPKMQSVYIYWIVYHTLDIY